MTTKKSAGKDEPKKTSRKKAEPEAAEPAVKDRTMFRALAVLAAVAVFSAGFAFGKSAGDDQAALGSDVVAERDGRFPRSGPGDFPGDRDGQGRKGPGERRRDGPDADDFPEFPAFPDFSDFPEFPGDDFPQDRPGDEAPAGSGYLGVRGVDAPRGVLIVEVRPGSPADEGGVEPGDRVLEFDGIEIDSMEQFGDLVRWLRPGTEVEMVVASLGERRLLEVVIGARPE